MRARRRTGRGIVLAIGVALLGLTAAACGGGASADADGMGFDAVPDRVTRLVIDVDSSFDEFKSRYEQAVPSFSPDKLAGVADWDAVVARMAELAPQGFLLYGKIDAAPVMKLNGHPQRADPHLRRPQREIHFSIDQPSTRFSSFGNDDIAATGKRLDQKLAELLTHLGLPVPGQLR
jgi:hypothetical protein